MASRRRMRRSLASALAGLGGLIQQEISDSHYRLYCGSLYRHTVLFHARLEVVLDALSGETIDVA